jgi:peptidoglycan/xylan/chitin deacetylase (PgdA/CDA1 family)
MYHRFSNESRPGCISKAVLENQLQYILKYYKVISLDEYILKKRNGHKIQNEIVITIDDGYYDFYEYAYPLLKKYNFTATLFVSSDFIEQKIWMWWDLIEYILKTNIRKTTAFTFEDFKIFITNNEDISKTWLQITDRCLEYENSKKWDLIYSLANHLKVNVPERPVPEFSSITIDQAKELLQNGISIAAHSKTHPILTRVKKERLNEEIGVPKARLEKLLGTSINTFCYPNGQESDLNKTIVDAVEDSGYLGAVIAYIDDSYEFNPYKISRLGVTNDMQDFLWKLYGCEILILAIRRIFLKLFNSIV